MAAATVLTPHDAAQLTSLRAELKQWEKTFAAANGGRKAGRDDIKQDVNIAAKYKIYGRLKALEEGQSQSLPPNGHEKRPNHTKASSSTSKRKHAAYDDEQTQPNELAAAFTPRKTSRHDHHFATPSHPHHGPKSKPAAAAAGQSYLNNHHPSQLDPYDSPSALRRLFNTPRSTHRNRNQSDIDDIYPSSQSPLPLKTAIGPTPQRDGRTLGLFDLLSASGGSRRGEERGDPDVTTTTPSGKRGLASLGNNRDVAQTPSRNNRTRGGDEEDDELLNIRLGRTPMSSSKKFYLEKLFATPTTLRFATMVEDYGDHPVGGGSLVERGGAATGSGDAVGNTRNAQDVHDNDDPLGSNTPAFLRRSSSARYLPGNGVVKNKGATSSMMMNGNGNGNGGIDLDLSPVAIRKPGPRFVGKGLSAIVQGLRDMENEKLEENWEILREIEEEEAAAAAATVANDPSQEGELQVNDSQTVIGTDASGNLREYKKKGQKRTTRLVRMKPVQYKAKQTPATSSVAKGQGKKDHQPNEDESEDELAVAPGLTSQGTADQPSEQDKGQVPGSNLPEFNIDSESDSDNNNDHDDDSDLDYSGAEENAQQTQSSQKRPTKFTDKIKAAFAAVKSATQSANHGHDEVKPTTSKKRKSMATAENDEDGSQTKKKTKTTARKVNPQAHANYRSLKIRNKGSGKGRFGGGRFGRRR